MKNKILITLFTAMLMLIFTACGEKKEDLTGKWEQTTDEYSSSMEFFSDGSGLLSSYGNDDGTRSYDCTWVAENGRFKLTVDYGVSGTKSFTGSYELEKNTLTLYYDDDPEVYVYNRK